MNLLCRIIQSCRTEIIHGYRNDFHQINVKRSYFDSIFQTKDKRDYQVSGAAEIVCTSAALHELRVSRHDSHGQSRIGNASLTKMLLYIYIYIYIYIFFLIFKIQGSSQIKLTKFSLVNFFLFYLGV